MTLEHVRERACDCLLREFVSLQRLIFIGHCVLRQTRPHAVNILIWDRGLYCACSVDRRKIEKSKNQRNRKKIEKSEKIEKSKKTRKIRRISKN